MTTWRGSLQSMRSRSSFELAARKLVLSSNDVGPCEELVELAEVAVPAGCAVTSVTLRPSTYGVDDGASEMHAHTPSLPAPPWCWWPCAVYLARPDRRLRCRDHGGVDVGGHGHPHQAQLGAA